METSDVLVKSIPVSDVAHKKGESAQRIAVVTLNRKKAKNALNKSLSLALSATLGKLRADPTVQAIVLQGAGNCFCAGVDLKDPMFADPSMMSEAAFNGPQNSLWQLRKSTIPVIAAVAGPCITGGMELALNADIIIASSSAFFQDTHARYGIIPGGGMTTLLPKSIGLHAAKWMSLTCSKVSAAKALEMGLVSEVVKEDSELEAAAIALARKICSNNGLAVKKIKAMHNEGFGYDVQTALEREASTALAAYKVMAAQSDATRATLSSKFLSRSKL